MNHTKDPSVGPWMLKELLGVGHQPGQRSTDPYLLGVVVERLPEDLQRQLREIDYDQLGEPLNVRKRLELVAAIATHIATHIESTARKGAEMLGNQEKPKFYSDSKAEWLAGKAENDRFMAEMTKLGRLSEVSVSSDYDNNPWEQK
jgi:hypothetical protein